MKERKADPHSRCDNSDKMNSKVECTFQGRVSLEDSIFPKISP